MDSRTQPLRRTEKAAEPPAPRERRCLACGTERMGSGRRYCSPDCRLQMLWVLSLSKGLLRALNTRYAAFSFTKETVILDVFPVWSRHISRFVYTRSHGNKPAQDLKNLVLEFGREWHGMVNNRQSRSFASLFLVEQNHQKDLHPDAIRPDSQTRPRLTREEVKSLKALRLERQDLTVGPCSSKIRSAYRRMAKVHHPDVGGDAEAFKQLQNAHEQMLLWAENPQYSSRKALRDCWSYDGATSRWSPPL